MAIKIRNKGGHLNQQPDFLVGIQYMQWIFVRQPDLLYCGYPSGSHPTNSPVTHISNTSSIKVSFW